MTAGRTAPDRHSHKEGCVSVQPQANPSAVLFLDTETTGLSHADEIIEFAAVLASYDRETGRLGAEIDHYHGLREPRCPIGHHATKIHGLTMSDVYRKQLDYRKIESLMTRADFIVAHNAGFDKRFVTQLFPSATNLDWRCSARQIKWTDLGFPNGRLQQLLAAHGIQAHRAHRALDDVRALMTMLRHRKYFSALCDHRPANIKYK